MLHNIFWRFRLLLCGKSCNFVGLLQNFVIPSWGQMKHYDKFPFNISLSRF